MTGTDLALLVVTKAERCSMMNQGAIVTYREFSRKVAGYCGIVEGVVQDKPNHVLVRWVGNTSESEESVSDLEEV
ncbi:MAG: hypothetical protein HY911_14015 [Desulfobacterales bacterium]|nr:hypothetical protein [Desulfobacterales bacterium]